MRCVIVFMKPSSAGYNLDWLLAIKRMLRARMVNRIIQFFGGSLHFSGSLRAGFVSVVILFAIPLSVQAADLGTALERYKAGDFIGAVDEWKEIARAGDPDALFNLGQVYRLGRGVEVGMEVSAYYYRRAAEAGHPEAQGNLATVYYFDPDQPDKKGEAITWWRLAARKGHPWSQYMLAVLHFNGDGVPQDNIQAFAWMVLAREAGVDQALVAERVMRRSMSVNDLTQGRLLSRALVEVPLGQLMPSLSIPDPFIGTDPSWPGVVPATPATPGTPGAPPSTSSPSAPSSPAAPQEPPRANTVVQGGLTAQDGLRPHGEVGSMSISDEPLRGWRIQLGSFRSADAPMRYGTELADNHSDLLEGLEQQIQEADLGERGVYFRLVYGSFADRAAAKARCDAFDERGMSCVIINP